MRKLIEYAECANDLSAYAQACRMPGTNDLRGALPGISSPTTVIVGEDDHAAPPAMAQVMHEAIRNSQYVLIGRARHLTPDRVASEFTMLKGKA